MNTSMLRTRWAAIGAAVAVTLGAGGLATTYATNPAGAVAFVPITPCRLVDTRPAPDNVGPRSTPIGAAEILAISAHGSNGNCTAASAIPTSATGLELNVTAIGATSGTFLTIWAQGAPQPTASNLNPQPGAPPIPNSVTTGLSGSGQFNIFNGVGSVNVIVDVVGYYTDHNHDDRYYTKAQTDAAVANRPATATGKLAYAFVCNAAANSVVGTTTNLATTCQYSYNPGGDPVVNHSATGTYVVTFPALDLTRGHVQVTSYGITSDTCKVAAWGGTTVTVLCHNTAGTLNDGRFTVLMME